MFQTHHCEFVCEGLVGDGLGVPPGRCSWVVGRSGTFGLLWALPLPHLSVSLFLVVSLSFWPRPTLASTTFSDGCLGSINDEGRSEVR